MDPGQELDVGSSLYCKDSSLNGATCPPVVLVPHVPRCCNQKPGVIQDSPFPLTLGFKQFLDPVNPPSYTSTQIHTITLSYLDTRKLTSAPSLAPLESDFQIALESSPNSLSHVVKTFYDLVPA